MLHRNFDVLGQFVYLPKECKKANHDTGRHYQWFCVREELKSCSTLKSLLKSKTSQGFNTAIIIIIISWEYRE